MGFDFPIGIPARYAALVGIEEFKSFLLQLGVGEFSDRLAHCSGHSAGIKWAQPQLLAGAT